MPVASEPVRVLCVDDDDALLSLVGDMLERADDDIVTETVGRPGGVLETLEAGAFDCVVCDYDMPRMTGLDVLEAIRDAYPDLPFILYTGKGSEEIASEAISAGVTDYLQKGSGTEHYELLANRITEYVDRYRTTREFELSEERYRRLVEQSMVGIGLSQDGVFEYVNPRFADLFGYDPDALVGADVREVVAPSDHDRLFDAIERREDGDVDTIHYVLTGQRRDGEAFEVEVVGSRITHDGGPAVLGLVQPLSDRRGVLSTRATTGPELRMRVEQALAELSTADATAPAAAVDALEAALAALGELERAGDDAAPGTDGVVAVAERCEATLAAADADVALTVDGSLSAVASATAVDHLFESFWNAWGDAPAAAATFTARADGFELRLTADDDGGFEAPPDPTAVARAAELLGWDVHVERPGPATRTYAFRHVTTE